MNNIPIPIPILPPKINNIPIPIPINENLPIFTDTIKINMEINTLIEVLLKGWIGKSLITIYYMLKEQVKNPM